MLNNLVLCGAASGCGYEMNSAPVPSTPVFVGSTASSGNLTGEPLELAVGFGALDVIGSILTTVPEPTCQAIGHCLSIPSRLAWVYQCLTLCRRWLSRPKR